ncbi:hypothetical protein [Piscirickettsia litoralis]|uniref:Uncharacterized protein n=1 Tax=Piscirickettsia litoralis TaxID=1891921 RepID=A0ABX3A8G0_9GAMM|nr:hypothetical protein [Piscirickettsia litoralis]ODN43720.1 hypothetical protein BGC07_13460 [Piscirickettsia litoralis]
MDEVLDEHIKSLDQLIGELTLEEINAEMAERLMNIATRLTVALFVRHGDFDKEEVLLMLEDVSIGIQQDLEEKATEMMQNLREVDTSLH